MTHPLTASERLALANARAAEQSLARITATNLPTVEQRRQLARTNEEVHRLIEALGGEA